MWTKLLLTGLGLALVGLGITVVVQRSRVEQSTTRVVEALLAASTAESGAVVRASDVAGVPAPVRRYLRHVLREGQPYIKTVSLKQHGTFRSDESGAWRPFTATQHVTTQPPGFVWNATIEMMPWLPVRVLDAYHDGRGTLRATLGGILPVMQADAGPALDEGELLRYLAEAPLYPTALLPGAGVTWAPIDDASARATLTDGATTASLVFHFNERNEVERVRGSRPFTRPDGSFEERPWAGTWGDYEERAGMLVPTEGEVAWGAPGEEAPYWRGHIDRVSYRFGTGDRADVPASVPPSSPAGEPSSGAA